MVLTFRWKCVTNPMELQFLHNCKLNKTEDGVGNLVIDQDWGQSYFLSNLYPLWNQCLLAKWLHFLDYLISFAFLIELLRVFTPFLEKSFSSDLFYFALIPPNVHLNNKSKGRRLVKWNSMNSKPTIYDNLWMNFERFLFFERKLKNLKVILDVIQVVVYILQPIMQK